MSTRFIDQLLLQFWLDECRKAPLPRETRDRLNEIEESWAHGHRLTQREMHDLRIMYEDLV